MKYEIKNRFTVIDNTLSVTLPLTQGEKLIVSVERHVWCREDEEMRRHNIRCNGITARYATEMLPGTYQMTPEIADKIVDGSSATVLAIGVMGGVMSQAYVVSFDCLEDAITVNNPVKSFEDFQKDPWLSKLAKGYITSKTKEERLQCRLENLSRMLEYSEFDSGKFDYENRFTLFTNAVVGEIGDRLCVAKVDGCIVRLTTPDGTEDNGCIVISGNLPGTTSMNSKIAYRIMVGSYATVISEGKLKCLGNKPRALIVSFDCLEQ